MIFLKAMITGTPIYLTGIIPLFIGARTQPGSRRSDSSKFNADNSFRTHFIQVWILDANFPFAERPMAHAVDWGSGECGVVQAAVTKQFYRSYIFSLPFSSYGAISG
jgi:hypothetical protein